MPQPAQQQILANVVSLLRSAQQLLKAASQNTNDVGKLLQINLEYNHLDSCISQLLHAQALTDDAQFASAVSSLKQQATSLATEETHIQAIVSDVATAAKIVAYVGQAVTFIGGL
jgi:hypothetical protein